MEKRNPRILQHEFCKFISNQIQLSGDDLQPDRSAFLKVPPNRLNLLTEPPVRHQIIFVNKIYHCDAIQIHLLGIELSNPASL